MWEGSGEGAGRLICCPRKRQTHPVFILNDVVTNGGQRGPFATVGGSHRAAFVGLELAHCERREKVQELGRGAATAGGKSGPALPSAREKGLPSQERPWDVTPGRASRQTLQKVGRAWEQAYQLCMPEKCSMLNWEAWSRAQELGAAAMESTPLCLGCFRDPDLPQAY